MNNSANLDLVMPEVDFGTDEVPDLTARLLKLQREGNRVVPVRYNGGHAWLVLGYDDVLAAYTDEHRLPGAASMQQLADTAGNTLSHMRGDEHRKFRTALAPAFSPSVIRGLIEELLVPTADNIIDDFGDLRELELNEAYNRRYSFNIISLLLGVPIPADRAAEKAARELVGSLIQFKEASMTIEMRRAHALLAVEAVNAWLRPVVEARRAAPQEDMISYLLSMEVSGKKLDEEQIYALLRSLYFGGTDTTAMMLGNLMLTILSDPDLKADLLVHPEKRVAMINEALRLYGPTGLAPRYSERDITIAGVNIPAHSFVLMGIPGANRDPGKYDQPDKILLDRKQTRQNQLLTFGLGVHSCIGLHLARMEIQVTLDRFLERLPGLRLAGKPGQIVSCMLRGIPQLWVRFDDVLPRSSKSAQME